MKKRLLASLMCLCMLVGLMPTTAWAAESSAEKAVTLTHESISVGYDSINDALENVKSYHYSTNKEPYTIQLNHDITENVVIPAHQYYLTIDLNGHTLTGNGDHTIINHGKTGTRAPVITDSSKGKTGVVDNVTHGKAAIYNDVGAKITLSGGTYMRSNEAGESDSASGGNSFYVIKNFGTMTIQDNAVVKFNDRNPGVYSSLIGNGWQDAAAAEENKNGEPKPSTGKNKAELTISGGTFIGGQITIKNDDYGILTIRNGTFTQPSEGRSAVANNHKATIKGGTFTSKTGPAVYSRHYDGAANDGTLTISGGTFTSVGSHAVALLTSGTKAIIDGGTFSAGIDHYGVYGVDGTTTQISGGTFKVGTTSNISNLDSPFVPAFGAVGDSQNGFEIQVTDPVATVQSGESATGYATLNDAMENAPAGSTVILQKDTTPNGMASSDHYNVTVDLNGHNITFEKGTAIDLEGYGSIPEGEEPFLRVTNSIPGQGGVIRAKVPVSAHALTNCPLVIGTGVTLETIESGGNVVKLGDAAYLPYDSVAASYIKNGGYLAQADDGRRIYNTYKYAVAAATDRTAVLMNNLTGGIYEYIDAGDIAGTLDLGGHTFICSNSNHLLSVEDGVSITIKNGTLSATKKMKNGVISALDSNSTVVLDGVTVNAPGSDLGIVTHGSKENNKITLKNSTLNVPDGYGIYFPSTGTLTIENSTINANQAGVELRAGTLIVKDSTITAKDTFDEEPNSSGPTMTGVAVAVSQHTTNHDINVTISGDSVLKGEKAFYEKDLQNEAVSNIKMTVTGGKFNGDVYSENCKNFITGGHFSSDPTAYLAADKAALPGTEPGYAFTVGDKVVPEAEVEPATGDPVVDDSSLPDDMTTEEKAAVTEIAASVEDSGELAAAANSVLDTVDEAKSKAAEDALRAPDSGVTVNPTDEVKTYVQTYLDIKPTAYDADKQTFTLDITPMYRVVASTAGSATDIKVVGEVDSGANAVVLKGSEAELTTLKTMTISVTLPDAWSTAYVQHKGHEYVATVANKVATFTNPHGFSKFVISAAPAAVAEVNGERYMNLTDALNAAKDKDTVTILNAPDANTNFIMSGDSREITVKNSTGNALTVTINGEKHENVTDGGSFQVKYTRPSSGGSSSSYTVNVEDGKNGTVTASHKSASKNTTVTLTVKADKGYELDELTVTDKNGKELKLTDKGNGKYTFAMPASNVTVKASFQLVGSDVKNPFTDVTKKDYFYQPVLWALDQGITAGTSATTFGPHDSCTRAQMVTFLWRAAGSTVVDYAMDFTDVPANAYYTEAVRWAVSKGITAGTGEGTFSPDATVSRCQSITFLWRAAGSPVVNYAMNFTDVPANAYYTEAVRWAVSEGITAGVGNSAFGPDLDCTRGQIMAFLYQAN